MPSPTTLALAVVWLLVGGAVALRVHAQGHPRAATIAAVPCWPLLLPLLLDRVEPAGMGGPASLALARLVATLLELGEPLPLDALRAAVLGAERRLLGLDRLLAEGEGLRGEDRARILAARASAATDLDALAGELTRLRLDLSLATLGGERTDLHERLADLHLRVRAMTER